jgi:ABC-type sulfate/molybdate transport systems ATPase subunit
LLRVRICYGVAGNPCSLRQTISPVSSLASGSSPIHLEPRTVDQPRRLHLHADFALTTRRNVLFGASGAGKSTLLRLIAGLALPDEGTIAMGDLTLTNTGARVALPPGRRGIGYLTQEPALFPHLSVVDNIAFGINNLSREARRARAAAMVTLFSLHSLAGRMPDRLSGGERQRVALARALAPGPSLLLLDEPFAALDAPLREKTLAALNHYLQTRETTVLSVSHDVAEVYASGAEVLLLEGGRIAAQGPSHLVLASQRELLLRQLGAQPAGRRP